MSSTCRRAHFPSTARCEIDAEVRNRNGTDRWWCKAHGAPAWGPQGQRLDECVGARAKPTGPASTLRIDPNDFPGGVGIWGALPAILSSEYDSAPSGVHVHARLKPDGPKIIDETFDAVTVVSRANEFVIDGRSAASLVVPSVFGFPTKRLACPHCDCPHLDIDEFCGRPHVKHQCNRCGRHFYDPEQEAAVSNPLAGLATQVQPSVPTFVEASRTFSVRQRDYPGGVSIWGSNPALLWTRQRPEEIGIHVHAWAGPNELAVDDTFRAVQIDGVDLPAEMVRTLMVQNSLQHLEGRVRNIVCPSCNHAHFDRGIDALTPHHHEICTACGRQLPTEIRRRLFISNPIVTDLANLSATRLSSAGSKSIDAALRCAADLSLSRCQRPS